MQPAITRTVLQRADLTNPGHEAVTARADFPVGGSTGKHTHPGDEVSYVLTGTIILEIDGAPAKTLKAGEVFFVPAGKVHNATAANGTATVVANYLVETGKPMTAAVP
jgi:quercetin dioxygenase-like cupin family protein